MPQDTWSIETAIFTKATTTKPIYDLIGGAANPRVFPEVRFDGQQRPCLVYELMTSNPYQVLSGVPSLIRSVVSIDCLGDTKKDAIQLARVVQDAFQDWSEVFTSGATVKINVQSTKVSSIQTTYEPPPDGATYGLFIASVEVTCIHSN